MPSEWRGDVPAVAREHISILGSLTWKSSRGRYAAPKRHRRRRQGLRGDDVFRVTGEASGKVGAETLDAGTVGRRPSPLVLAAGPPRNLELAEVRRANCGTLASRKSCSRAPK